MKISVNNAESDEQIQIVRELLREYESWLDFELCTQDLEKELATLPGLYSRPEGRLLVAFVDRKPAGCVAMRRFDSLTCEMKRLYVKPEFRSIGLGKILITRLLEEASGEGYWQMRLDTHPKKMAKAVSLYESYDFRQIFPTDENLHKDLLYMEKKLFPIGPS